MNTFKKGDVITVRGSSGKSTVDYTDGPFVHYSGRGCAYHQDCTLVEAPFKPGDLVKVTTLPAIGPVRVKRVEDGFVFYEHPTYNGANCYPNDAVLVRRASEPKFKPGDVVWRHPYGESVVEKCENGKVTVKYDNWLGVCTGNEDHYTLVSPARLPAPVAAAVADQKFKVGDRVRALETSGAPGWFTAGKTYTVAQALDAASKSEGQLVRCVGDHGTLPVGMYAKAWELVTEVPTIVIRRDTGKGLRPNDNPRVHASAAEATKEAERLALANPGVEFLTFSQGSVSVATAPSVKTVAA